MNQEELQKAHDLFADLTPDISQNYENSDNKDNTFVNWTKSELWETKASGGKTFLYSISLFSYKIFFKFQFLILLKVKLKIQLMIQTSIF